MSARSTRQTEGALVQLLLILVIFPTSSSKDTHLNPSTSQTKISNTNLFNPSVLVTGGRVLCAFRSSIITRRGNMEWWYNKAYICESSFHSMRPASCADFEPFSSARPACRWTDGTEGTETDGIEDVKLFKWPGIGEGWNQMIRPFWKDFACNVSRPSDYDKHVIAYIGNGLKCRRHLMQGLDKTR
jgi:hypothetical protein